MFTHSWADGPMLGVVSGIQLPQHQGCSCHIFFKNPPQRDKLADSGIFSPRLFPQSSYPQYWDLSLALSTQDHALLHNLWTFSNINTCSCLTLFTEFLPPFNLQKMGHLSLLQLPYWPQRGHRLIVSACVTLLLLCFIVCAFKPLISTLVTGDNR